MLMNYFKLSVLLFFVLACSAPTNAKTYGLRSVTDKEAMAQELMREAQLKSVAASYDKAKAAEFELLQKLAELRQPATMLTTTSNNEGNALKCDPSGSSCSPAFQAKNVCCSGLCVPIVLSFYGVCS